MRKITVEFIVADDCTTDDFGDGLAEIDWGAFLDENYPRDWMILANEKTEWEDPDES